MKPTHKIINVPFDPYNWGSSNSFGAACFSGSEQDCFDWFENLLEYKLPSKEWVKVSQNSWQLQTINDGQIIQRLKVVEYDYISPNQR